MHQLAAHRIMDDSGSKQTGAALPTTHALAADDMPTNHQQREITSFDRTSAGRLLKHLVSVSAHRRRRPRLQGQQQEKGSPCRRKEAVACTHPATSRRSERGCSDTVQ